MSSNGFRELSNQLGRMADNLKDLQGKTSLPAEDLLTPGFVSRHTRFRSFQEMLDAGCVEREEDLEGQQWSDFIAANSGFGGWRQMAEKALEEYVERKIQL